MSAGESGSVLLEALVSTLVVAAALGATFTAVGAADHQRRQIDARRSALMIARSELAAVGAEIPLRPGRVGGVDGDFAWRIMIEPGQANALNGSLAGPPATITVAVSAASGGPDLVVLRTLRASASP
jgi:general secretion pathway protein I